MVIENSTLSQRIADAIALRIAQGSIQQGERLLENELTEIFRTSRAPIREAMYILEKEGIVERFPRKGVFVKKHTKKELVDLYEVAYRLTEVALQRALDNVTEQELKALDIIVEQMESTVIERDIPKCFELLWQMQMQLFELSNNDVLKSMYKQLDRRLKPFRYASLSHPTRLNESIQEYRKIVEGIREKDFDKILTNLREKEKRALSVLMADVVVDK